MNSSSQKIAAWPPPAAEDWNESERQLLLRLTPEDLPRHLAVIMDGNGRWAKARGLLDRIRGHEAGIESVREITRTCAMLCFDALTLYAFSKENWQRPRRETAALMRLLERFSIEERDELMENNVRLLMIGNSEDLPASVLRELQKTRELTSGNTGMRLVLALSYGGRDDIVRAARKLARRAVAGELDPAEIDEAAVSAALDTAGVPDPDFMIRTSGEFRVSNFLLWQLAYAELYITPMLWPDFRRIHLLEALLEYKNRERRFGGLGESDVKPRR
jgi:undecaprenyl diphosphate synthase